MERREATEGEEKKREKQVREKGREEAKGRDTWLLIIVFPFDRSHLLKTDVLLWGHYFILDPVTQ